MSLRPRLPDECLRYRKRKQSSLDGTVASVQSSRPRGRPVMANLGPWGEPPREYTPGPTSAYEPHPGFAEFPNPVYDMGHPEMPSSPTTPSLRIGPLPIAAGPPVSSDSPTYESLPMTDGLLSQAFEELESQPASDPIPIDHDVRADELLHAPNAVRAAGLEAQAWDPSIEIQSAIDHELQQAAAPPESPQPESMPEPQQMCDEQMQQLMDPWQMPAMGPMGRGR